MKKIYHLGSGFIVLALMIKVIWSAFEYYAVDLIGRQHFLDNTKDRI